MCIEKKQKYTRQIEANRTCIDCVRFAVYGVQSKPICSLGSECPSDLLRISASVPVSIINNQSTISKILWRKKNVTERSIGVPSPDRRPVSWQDPLRCPKAVRWPYLCMCTRKAGLAYASPIPTGSGADGRVMRASEQLMQTSGRQLWFGGWKSRVPVQILPDPVRLCLVLVGFMPAYDCLCVLRTSTS